MTTVAFGNIRANPVMAQKRVVQDTNLLFRMGQIVAACEIGPVRYNRAFRRAANQRQRRVFFERSANQIAVPDHLRSYGQKYKLTSGIAGINPSRHLNVVFCPTTKTAYVVTHFTNGAWNRKKKSRKAWRQKMWLRQEAEAARLIKQWSTEGWDIVIVGDMNRLWPPNFHGRQVLIIDAGIIQMIAVPAYGRRITVDERRIEKHSQWSDHPFISANIDFMPERRSV